MLETRLFVLNVFQDQVKPVLGFVLGYKPIQMFLVLSSLLWRLPTHVMVVFSIIPFRRNPCIFVASRPDPALCGCIFKVTVYENNNLFLLVSRWRKLLRNHIKCSAKKLGSQICGVLEPEKTSYVSCASKKRNKCWSFPHWWLISENTQSGPPKTVWFPASFPRRWPGVKGYSLAVKILKDRREMKRIAASWCLAVSGVFVPPFLERALLFVTCIFWCRYSR